MDNEFEKNNSFAEDATSLDSLFDAPVDGPSGSNDGEFYYSKLNGGDSTAIDYDDEIDEGAAKKKKAKKTKAAKPKKKRTGLVIVAVLLVLALLAAAYFFFGGKKFSVSFLDEDGTVLETVKVKEGKTVELIEAPKKEGLIFIEWQLNGKAYDPTSLVGSDLQLKAFYKKAMKVTFLNEDGTEFLVMEVGEGEILERPEKEPEAKNKAFVTWLTEDGKVFSFLNPITEDVTLKAKMKDYIKPVGLAYANPEYRIYVNEEKDLPAVVTPGNTTETVMYESSDTKIFTVDSRGRVKGLKAGSATLTAKVEGLVATTTITVEEKPVVGLTIQEGSSIKVGKGKKVTLHPVIDPEDATHKEVTFVSSNDTIARVSSDGVVTGVKKGKCKITATSHNGITYEVEVEVYVAVERVELNVTSGSLVIAGSGNSSVTISATIYPDDADVKTVKWYYMAGGEIMYFTPTENGNTLTITASNFEQSSLQQLNISAEADGVQCSNPMTVYIEPRLTSGYYVDGQPADVGSATVGSSITFSLNIEGTIAISDPTAVLSDVNVYGTGFTATAANPGSVTVSVTTRGGQYYDMTIYVN